jgi:hypothetical protein
MHVSANNCNIPQNIEHMDTFRKWLAYGKVSCVCVYVCVRVRECVRVSANVRECVDNTYFWPGFFFAVQESNPRHQSCRGRVSSCDVIQFARLILSPVVE